MEINPATPKPIAALRSPIYASMIERSKSQPVTERGPTEQVSAPPKEVKEVKKKTVKKLLNY